MYSNYSNSNSILDNGLLIDQVGKRTYSVISITKYNKELYKKITCKVNLNSKQITNYYDEIRAVGGLTDGEYMPEDVVEAAVSYFGAEAFARPDDIEFLPKDVLIKDLKELDLDKDIKVQ